MAVKLAAYARRASVDASALIAAYELAVAHRLTMLRDVFHPDLLHPARSALILLEDAGCTDADVLAAAALVESEFPQLRVPERDASAQVAAGVLDLVRAVPRPADAGEVLLEALLAAPADVALIAVAERLDHARHLHFREPHVWPSFHAQIGAVYLPFAARISDPLATRLLRWSDAFARRFLSSA